MDYILTNPNVEHQIVLVIHFDIKLGKTVINKVDKQ